jgi:DNA polymerase I-like protein with 3'-5' exonuclease and polymerase domains
MTDYGDYESELTDFIDQYKKKHGILKRDFRWEFIPFETMVPYAATDAVVTLIIFSKLVTAVAANKKLNNVYRNILLPASTALIQIQQNGVPFDKQRLEFGQQVMSLSIAESIEKLQSFTEIKEFEEEQKAEFNANSPKQLRELLFTKLKLNPTGKKTATKADSTDAEVLKMLSSLHPVPNLILNIRKKSKVKNTYLDKIIVNLNTDFRLRTNFNIHGTVAGRLSSSGKLNMQQLPRDASVVKGSLKARPGYKIVSMDLKTAEVYVAAILSGDKDLMQVFIDDADFHSTIAKRVFKLSCSVEDVKSKFPDLRQAAKTVTFSILYQAGAYNLHDQVNMYIRDNNLDMSFTMRDAELAIENYFKEFPMLKKWIDKNKDEIALYGYIYSSFGRKRRLPNVKSDNRATASHAIRSGLNFLVQSPASDVNLLATVDMQNWLVSDGKHIDSKIFALVHDSILAEVKIEHIDEYVAKLATFVQKNRGLSIPNTPIGYEFEVGDDYSFGKFEKDYGDVFRLWCAASVEHREALLQEHYGVK